MTSLWDNPIFLRTRQVERRRGPRPTRYLAPILLALTPFSLAGLLALPYMPTAETAWHRPPGPAALDVAVNILGPALFYCQILLGCRWIYMAALQIFAHCSGEREHQTLDSLRSTLLSASEVVQGTLAAGLWPVLREMAVAGPMFLAGACLAGQAPVTLSFFAHVLPLTLLAGLCGMLVRRQSQATLSAYLLMLASQPTRLVAPALGYAPSVGVDVLALTVAAGLLFLQVRFLHNRPEAR